MFMACEMCSAFEFLGLNHCATIAGSLCKIIFIFLSKTFLFASFAFWDKVSLCTDLGWPDLKLGTLFWASQVLRSQASVTCDFFFFSSLWMFAKGVFCMCVCMCVLHMHICMCGMFLLIKEIKKLQNNENRSLKPWWIFFFSVKRRPLVQTTNRNPNSMGF